MLLTTKTLRKMAKIRKSLMKLSGTLHDATFVNSKTYGRHVRAPRGTYKEADVNLVFQQNAGQAATVNGTCKVIHDHIKSICDVTFKGSGLWREMLKRARTAPSITTPDILASMKGLEINSAYPLDRVLILPQVDISVRKGKLSIDLALYSHPHFPYALRADNYYYTVHLLWLDKKGATCGEDGIETEWVNLQDDVPGYELEFDMPARTHYYVLLLEVEAGQRQVPLDVAPGKGMRILEVDKVEPRFMG